MSSPKRALKFCAALGVLAGASFAVASPASAMHGYRHVRAVRAAAAEPVLVPAHQRASYVGITAGGGVFGPIGLIDLGLGPVFPFSGWP